MDTVSIVVWVIALVLGIMAFFRPGRLHLQGLRIAWRYFYTMVPRMAVALLVSGFFSVLVPTELIASSIGAESGIRGIITASLVGGFTPGGPIIAFPVVFVLQKAGAGVPQLIAFLTAWSVFAFHRIIAFEVPLMGIRFTALRVLSSLVLPPLAGILATGLAVVFG